MKSIILTDSQFEDYKQSVILQTRSLKEEIAQLRNKRDYWEFLGNYPEALDCSRKLEPLFKKLEECYDLLFKLAQC